jgi:hypothetical protein
MVMVAENMSQDVCKAVACYPCITLAPQWLITINWYKITTNVCGGGLMKSNILFRAAIIWLAIAAVFSVQAEDSLAKQRLARLPDTPVEQLQKYAIDPDWRVRREVATNRRAPAALLNQLASDSVTDVKIAVATNIATDEKTFLKLATDPDKTIRSVVARFEFVPANVLDKLANDPDPDIRLEVTRSFNVSETTLKRLSEDDYPQIRELAIQILTSRQE